MRILKNEHNKEKAIFRSPIKNLIYLSNNNIKS